MEKVKDFFGETVHLAIEEEGQVGCISKSIQPADRSVNRLAVGKRASMHCTGVGKAILAHLPRKGSKRSLNGTLWPGIPSIHIH